jgi:hypothetical protein
MPIGVAPKLDSLYLSKGQNFIRKVRLFKDYAASTKAEIIITDEAGIELALWSGSVQGRWEGRFADFDDIDGADSIPHGARFVLRLTEDNGDVVNVAYGRVVRGDHRYPLIPTAVSTNFALQFSDTFDRKEVGKYWIPRSSGNAISIHNNPLNIPNTLGPNFSLFNSAAALWYAPLNTDTLTVTVSMMYVGDGKCTVVLCSDYSMKTWVGVQFTTGLFNDKVRIVRGKTPTTYDDVPGYSPVNNIVRNNDIYVIRYIRQNRSVSCFKNSGATPLAYWEDTNDLIATGPGYRYTGLVWNTSLFTPGAEPSSWSAKDGM